MVEISKGKERLEQDSRTEPIIGAAIEVHRQLGPGLLESTYEECLCHELHLRRIRFQRQLDLPVLYKGLSSTVDTAWIYWSKIPYWSN